MKFGVSLLGLVQQPLDEDLARRAEDVIAWVHEARDAGFHSVISGQHYLTHPFQELQPVPLLARLIPESGDMELFGTLIAPLHNPVDLAETWASLDVLSGGRMGLCFALGYRDEEYAAFGVDTSQRVRDFRDVIETVRALWTQDEVTATGRGFTIENATCTTRPVRKPHPPIWIAANADPAVKRAARWGLPWNINPHARYETIERQVGLYHDSAREAGIEPAELPLQREVFCAPTREEAIQTAGPHLARKYAAYDQWGQDKALPGEEEFAIPFAQLAQDRFILGDPDDCAREIAKYRKLGVDRLHMRMNWPGMALEPAVEALRLFGAEVAPRFADKGGGSGP
ncbi:MAG: LLM class flavin-dependent oxidoreductase [Nitriliruptorales bacterium]|nr:LLM class flavin-dependent oxidoreductase [Nitriliruptorales bacterium]